MKHQLLVGRSLILYNNTVYVFIFIYPCNPTTTFFSSLFHFSPVYFTYISQGKQKPFIRIKLNLIADCLFATLRQVITLRSKAIYFPLVTGYGSLIYNNFSRFLCRCTLLENGFIAGLVSP